MKHNATLLYIHDPMCSWCYGFKPVLELLHTKLELILDIKYVLGGLAEDSDLAMPDNMKKQIKQNWKTIETTIPNTMFNYEFWTNNIARRSTYPSCRAVIATMKQDKSLEKAMINLIQKAYYVDALNPSDYNILYDLSKTLNLNHKQFINDIHSAEVNTELMSQIQLSREIGADSFPSLYLYKDKKYQEIVLDYTNGDIIIEHIKSFLNDG